MSDYTPTTDDVADAWASRYDGEHTSASGDERRGYEAEFDRWLVARDREVAERAWDACVGEMPIDPDWKNFYSDQNPYTKEEQS